MDRTRRLTLREERRMHPLTFFTRRGELACATQDVLSEPLRLRYYSRAAGSF